MSVKALAKMFEDQKQIKNKIKDEKTIKEEEEMNSRSLIRMKYMEKREEEKFKKREEEKNKKIEEEKRNKEKIIKGFEIYEKVQKEKEEARQKAEKEKKIRQEEADKKKQEEAQKKYEEKQKEMKD